MKLSIIIICKNEEKHVSGSIESALAVAQGIGDAEVILVDSCSSDRTISIAQQYPIVILQLRPQWRHTPAAGRYIGFLRSCGKYVLFLDGDSTLEKGFCETALSHFERNDKIAAISGRRSEIYWEKGQVVGNEPDINKVGETIRRTLVAPGSAIYRRVSLAEVGCFNPYLFAEEEAELGERLIWAGHEIIAIPVGMVVHNTVPRERMTSLIRRMKNRFHLGLGQVIRYRVYEGLSSKAFFGKAKRSLQFLCWILIGALTLTLTYRTRSLSPFLSWAVLSCLLLVAFMVKSKNIKKPFEYTLIWSIQAYSLVKGFMLKPLRPDSYPTDALILTKNPMNSSVAVASATNA